MAEATMKIQLNITYLKEIYFYKQSEIITTWICTTSLK